jgi:hypothetical protein
MSQKSNEQFEEDFQSKLKRLHPRPEGCEDLHDFIPESQKKKLQSKSISSKGKFSTNKKGEVKFGGEEEIPENILEMKTKTTDENMDNNKNFSKNEQSTPIRSGSGGKKSLKSVKERQKTPYSKMKCNEDSDGTNTPINKEVFFIRGDISKTQEQKEKNSNDEERVDFELNKKDDFSQSNSEDSDIEMEETVRDKEKNLENKILESDSKDPDIKMEERETNHVKNLENNR